MDEPAMQPGGELVLQRPATMGAAPLRRIHVDLDGRQVADLSLGDSVHVAAPSGPHQIRARCRPLSSDDIPFILDPGESLKIRFFVDALNQLEIQLE